MVVAAHPLLQLARVSGRDAQAPDGRAWGAVHNVSVTLEAGVHAFVGRPADGTAALCELIAGRRAPSVGVLTVLGREPRQSARSRRHMAAVLPKPALAHSGTVADAVASIGRMRDHDLATCLAAFGAAQLSGRRVASLDADEARAVELAIALSCPDLRVLALFEPLLVALANEEVVRERIVQIAAQGACVVIATAAPEQLGSLPDHVYLLEAGRLWGRDREVGWALGAADAELPAGVRPPMHGIVLWLKEPHARAMIAAIPTLGAVEAVSWSLKEDGLTEVSVSGHELEALALGIADAVTSTGAEVVAMHSASVSLERMREAARAHRIAIESRARLTPPTAVSSTPPPPSEPVARSSLGDT